MTRLVILALAWALGGFLAQAFSFPPIWFLLAIPVGVVLLIGWHDEKWTEKVCFALIGLLLGTWRMAAAQPHINPRHIAFYNDIGIVTVEGVIRTEADGRAHLTNLRLAVDSITFPNGETRTVHGRVLVKAPAYTIARYGDRIQATGTLQTPPDFQDFSYRDYLARQGVHSLLPQADVTVLASHQASLFWEYILDFKHIAHDKLLALLPEPQASLLSGILLGIETGIPDDLNAAFVATGTSHIVAISGFNLSIIANVLIHTLRKVTQKNKVVFVALGCVWLYTLLVGGSAAVVRAALMATVAISTRYILRTGCVHGPTSLAIAVVLMQAWNPYCLWDVGFQLSVMATLGLILYTDAITQWVEALLKRLFSETWTKRMLDFLGEALLVTLAAQLTTMGIIIGTFGRLSLITLVTNMLVLPVQSLVMFTGAIVLFVSLIAPPLAWLCAWPAWFFLAWTTTIVQWTAKAPYASIELRNVTLPFVWGYYGVLFTLTWWWQCPKTERRHHWSNVWAFIAKPTTWIGIACLMAFSFFLYTLPDGRLHVAFLDVGYGDSIFIQTPTGKQVLIDGGPEPARTLSKLGKKMPFWDRHLDAIILTSPDEARLNGLVQILERYTVDYVIIGTEESKGSVYAHWRSLLAARVPETVGTLHAGQTWTVDTEVTLHALWPSVNVTGPLILRLVYDDTSFLLMSDATTRVEQTLTTDAVINSTVLHVARHGSKSAVGMEFLHAVLPECAIISTDARHSPAAATLARLMGLPVYRTDRHGTIEVISDGHTIQVKLEVKSGK